MKRPRKQSEWKKVMRAEAFSVYQSRLQASRFRINWSDQGGVRRRYKLWADSLEEATQKAQDLIAGRDPDQMEEKAAASENGPLVVEAFEQALAQTKRGERSRKQWQANQTRFINWLAKAHPEATHWRLVTRQMLREYILQTLPKEASANYIRLTLNPVVQTANYIERECNLPNPAKRMGIGNKLKKTPPLVPLTDVAAFLDWLREKSPLLEAGAALQGLAGLQLQEVTRLTWDKVDLEQGLVEISGEVKNAYRNRVIPVAGRVLEALHRAKQRQAEDVESKDKEPPTHVALSPEGLAFDGGSWFNYSKLLGAALRAWNPVAGWAPKDLRNCLPTYSVIEGLHSDLWEQYIGHAPKTVTGRHYVPRLAAATAGERELLKRRMELFRRMVVEPVERELGKMARKGHDPERVKTKSAASVSESR